MSEDEQVTRSRPIRIAEGAWSAYASVCKRLGRTRADDINAHIRRMIKRHGTPEEIAQLAAADAEIEQRRARKYSGLRRGRQTDQQPSSSS
jgi:hypothetical protein